MSLGERPRGSARPTPNEHYNSLLRTSIEGALGHLERLAGSLPEAHTVRLLAEEAVGSARARGAGYAGSAASRCRSKTEGRISRLRGILDRENALASKDA